MTPSPLPLQGKACDHGHERLGINNVGAGLGVVLRMRRPNRGSVWRDGASRGYTLVEALISVVIFGVGLSTFFGLFPYSLHEIRHANYYLQAVSVGQQYMDSMRSAIEQSHPLPGPESIAIDGGYSVTGNKMPATSPGNFSVTGSCVLIPPYTRLQECTVQVQWSENGFTRLYSVQSYATQQVS